MGCTKHTGVYMLAVCSLLSGSRSGTFSLTNGRWVGFKGSWFSSVPLWLTASLFDSIAIRCRSDVHHFFRRCSTLLIRVTRVKVKKENPRRLPLERQSTDSTGAPDDEGSSFWGVALPLIIWRRADAPLLRAGEFDSGG